MNRISRYLFTQLVVSVLFSLLAITIVVWFSQSVRLLSMVVNNGGSILSFLQLMLLILPTFLPLVLPLSLVVGCLFVFHRLTQENEIQVMKAVGVSPWNLARPALLLAAIVTGLGYILTLWVAPQANHALVRVKYELANDFSLLLLRTGNFHDIQDGLSFYAQNRGSDGELKGILIHDTRKPGRPSTIMAESGEMIRTEKGPNVLVKNGIRQELESSSGELSQLSFKTYLVDLSTIKNPFSERWREPRERSMEELLNPQGTDKDSVTMGRFMAELNLRLTLPMLALTFTFIGCGIMLTGFYRRDGMIKKIILATVIVVVIEATMLSTINMIARANGMVILLYLFTLLPIPFFWLLLLGRPVKMPPLPIKLEDV